jgi:endogenous inhibitor of DNA gyrase (YacG/DUF329 family)
VPELTCFVDGRYDRRQAVPTDRRPPFRDEPLDRGVTCSICGARAPWAGNPHRPFCSKICRLIDLGRWLDERYRVEEPGESGEEPDDDDVR